MAPQLSLASPLTNAPPAPHTASQIRGRPDTVVHGVGAGLRLDVALFAFLERATLRLDLAQPVGLGTGPGPVLWFGLNQVF